MDCAVIQDLLDQTAHGISGVLVLRGEAGIGKSALLDFAVQSAGDRTVLRGVCIESEASLPFAALHQVLYPDPAPAAIPAGGPSLGPTGRPGTG